YGTTCSRSSITADATRKKRPAMARDVSMPLARSTSQSSHATSGRFLRISARRERLFPVSAIRPFPTERLPTGAASHLPLLPFVRVHDVLHEPVADDVAALQLDHPNVLDAAKLLDGVDQAAAGVFRQVDLGRVAGDDHFRVVPEAREEHEHLRGG